jgi:signal transduction histidine kinase
MSADATFVIKRISRAARRMEDLTRDLLEFSKISRQEIVLSRVSVESVIEDVLALRSSSVRRAITVLTPLHEVRGHRGLLEQVLANMIDNAVKFVKPLAAPKVTIFTEPVSNSSPNTRSGPLVFSAPRSVSSREDASKVEATPNQIRIWVCDEGIGIPPEGHQKIFSIFERGTGSELYEGTGIGLAIVARATQRMGGTCGVESTLGEGSRFWLELPVPSSG